jgi:hypothetical protein
MTTNLRYTIKPKISFQQNNGVVSSGAEALGSAGNFVGEIGKFIWGDANLGGTVLGGLQLPKLFDKDSDALGKTEAVLSLLQMGGMLTGAEELTTLGSGASTIVGGASAISGLMAEKKDWKNILLSGAHAVVSAKGFLQSRDYLSKVIKPDGGIVARGYFNSNQTQNQSTQSTETSNQTQTNGQNTNNSWNFQAPTLPNIQNPFQNVNIPNPIAGWTNPFKGWKNPSLPNIKNPLEYWNHDPFNMVLKPGTTHQDVALLRQLLATFKDGSGKPYQTGDLNSQVYDNDLASVVKNFQAGYNSNEKNGVVDKETWSKLMRVEYGNPEGIGSIFIIGKNIYEFDSATDQKGKLLFTTDDYIHSASWMSGGGDEDNKRFAGLIKIQLKNSKSIFLNKNNPELNTKVDSFTKTTDPTGLTKYQTQYNLPGRQATGVVVPSSDVTWLHTEGDIVGDLPFVKFGDRQVLRVADTLVSKEGSRVTFNSANYNWNKLDYFVNSTGSSFANIPTPFNQATGLNNINIPFTVESKVKPGVYLMPVKVGSKTSWVEVQKVADTTWGTLNGRIYQVVGGDSNYVGKFLAMNYNTGDLLVPSTPLTPTGNFGLGEALFTNYQKTPKGHILISSDNLTHNIDSLDPLKVERKADKLTDLGGFTF